MLPRLRDIDYAAVAVRKAIVEKFGDKNELEDLDVSADDTTIRIHHGAHVAEGTRDDLLIAVRKAANYDDLWQALPHRAGRKR